MLTYVLFIRVSLHLMAVISKKLLLDGKILFCEHSKLVVIFYILFALYQAVKRLYLNSVS